ncbi:MAG: Gfo/Idh/MocA family oxidoreductase [Verrucomicrobiales bacterium]|nr:Gfo/Idh/MocA family oxidoreductase [Verrucomicrobiales bacterium]
MINVAVIGLGFMGVTHIKAYRKVPQAKVVGICDAFKLPADGVLTSVTGNVADPDPVKLDLAQVQATKDYKEILANPAVHAVDICLPTAQHVEVASAALQAGKHVVCEKPLARTSAQCREIVEAAKSAKGYFMPAMCMRFWPGWSWLKAAIADQRYGKVLAARFRRVSGPPGWSKGTYFKGAESGGALLDLHIHDTDFIQFLFGRPKQVFSRGLSRFSGAIDHVLTQYDVGGSIAVSAEGSWLMSEGFGFNMAYTVNFENATADFDLSRGPETLKIFEDGKGARVEAIVGDDGYVGELTHFIDSIVAGRAPSVVTPMDGAQAVEICEAEEQSVLSGKPVSL